MMMGPAPDTSANSRRTISFLIVVAVHIVFFWGLKAGLSNLSVERMFAPVATEIVEEKKVEEDRPPPPPPKIDTPPPFVPPPEISIEAPPTENTTAIQVTTSVRPTEPPPPVAAPKQKVTVQPKVDAKHGGLTKPEYPPSEKRAEHAGTVYLQLLVLETGRVGEARIQTSSGYPKLDEAAVSEAKRSWRFVPGSEDGKPVQMWVTVPLVFKLEN
jgi:periplasmic protein TonB